MTLFKAQIQKSSNEKIKLYLFLLLFLLIAVYFITRLFNFFSGPILDIKSPIPGQKITEPTFFVEGNAKNIKNLSINGKNTTVDEKGNFKEEVISKSPYTLIVIEATDKYQKNKEEIIKVSY